MGSWQSFLVLLQADKAVAVLAVTLVGYLLTANFLRLPTVAIPAVYASDFSSTITSENPAYAHSIKLGNDWCTPADLQVCTTAPPVTPCCTSALSASPFQRVSDSAVVLLGLLLPVLLMTVRAVAWRLALGVRYAQSFASAPWLGLDRSCTELLLLQRPKHTGGTTKGHTTVSFLQAGGSGDVATTSMTFRGDRAAAGPHQGASDEDEEGHPSDQNSPAGTAAAAQLGCLLARYGWLLFLWESFVCVPVAVVVQAVACLAVKVRLPAARCAAPQPNYGSQTFSSQPHYGSQSLSKRL